MRTNTILLTGASGMLGTAIHNSSEFGNLLNPSHSDMDITNFHSITDFFSNNNFDCIIHCAALARMKECQSNPGKAILVNTVGTSNLVRATLQKEKESKKAIRFLHISTDGVYASTTGNYSEQDATIPYNVYGWTKLGAETVVRALYNFCTIRTRFFDPEKIPYNSSATDSYTSQVPINYFVKSLSTLLDHNFVGVINVGGERCSDFDLYKVLKPDLKQTTFEKIQSSVPFSLSQDASMNISLWKKILRAK